MKYIPILLLVTFYFHIGELYPKMSTVLNWIEDVLGENFTNVPMR